MPEIIISGLGDGLLPIQGRAISQINADLLSIKFIEWHINENEINSIQGEFSHLIMSSAMVAYSTLHVFKHLRLESNDYHFADEVIIYVYTFSWKISMDNKKPLPETMMTQFTEAYKHHQPSIH